MPSGHSQTAKGDNAWTNGGDPLLTMPHPEGGPVTSPSPHAPVGETLTNQSIDDHAYPFQLNKIKTGAVPNGGNGPEVSTGSYSRGTERFFYESRTHKHYGCRSARFAE